MIIRSAAVEGRFYPSGKDRIFRQIAEIEASDRYPVKEFQPERIFGAVLPHAGHVYSGYQTIPFMQLVRKREEVPETFIIVHPNHSGRGLPISIDDAQAWRNSIGDVPIDHDLAHAMDLPFDNRAHATEHSAEVIIPYLQYFFPGHDYSFVPVCILDQSYESAVMVADRIVAAVQRTGRRIMVLASCDFSHYLPPQEGSVKDQRVIDQILSRNAKGVEMAIIRDHVTACGYGPIMVLMEYAGKTFAGYSIKVLARGHSGEVIPSREVVDYVSMIVYQ